MVNITVEADRYVNKPDYRLYEIVIYTFTIKRSTTYYVVLIIVPSLILALLCVVGLFWKRINADSYMNNVSLTALFSFHPRVFSSLLFSAGIRLCSYFGFDVCIANCDPGYAENECNR